MTWSGVTSTTRAWGMLSRTTVPTDGGVDFQYRLRESYPWLITSTQPLRIVSALSEGTP